jgi:hypothetical protein
MPKSIELDVSDPDHFGDEKRLGAGQQGGDTREQLLR